MRTWIKSVVLVVALPMAFAAPAMAQHGLNPAPYFDSVNRFVETVLEHGRDRYGAQHTPLFVDGLHSETLEPAIWLWRDSEEWVLSNFANQQALMRLLDGMSALTGDPKYREAAEAAAGYMLEHAVAGRGLLYWGGHTAWDLKAHRMVGTRSSPDTYERDEPDMIHELKANQPYWELMWRVNPDSARRAMQGVWGAHITNWETLDFNRHWGTHRRIQLGWDADFDEDGEIPFPTTGGLSFVGVVPPFTHTGVRLATLDDFEPGLTWSRRMIHQWQRARHPETGLSGGQVSWLRDGDRARAALGHIHPGINEAIMVASYHQRGRYHSLPLAQMQAAEVLIEAGEPYAAVGREFIAWASDDLKVYMELHDESTGLFPPVLNDGTPIRTEEIRPGYYTEADLLPIPPSGSLFWGHALAYRLTQDPAHASALRTIGKHLGLGDIAAPRAVIQTDARDIEALYGLLELYQATRAEHFLKLAAAIGDNLMALQTESGLYPRPAPQPRPAGTVMDHAKMPGVRQPDRVYARTGDEIPLALLHLAAAIADVRDQLPRAVRDEQYFHCQYHGPLEPHQRKRDDNRTYDWLVFYGIDGSW